MGWNDRFDDGELSNLPPEAWGNVADVDGPFDPCNDWLGRASRDDQLIAVREWFCARYCDPAHETPYNGAEGGYLYINGGPYSPHDELHDRFGGHVDDDVIEEVAEALVAEVGDEWAPIRDDMPPDEYDERYDLDAVGPDDPLRRLSARLDELQHAFSLQSDPQAQVLVSRLVFSAIIGVLESFLWETAQHWVEENEDVLQRCIEKVPAIRDRPMKLGEVFAQHAKRKEIVKAYMQNLVWHRWEQVGSLYKVGLEIQLPTVKPFEAPLLTRHHIVHRSGHDMDGKLIEISAKDISELAQAVKSFATRVAKLCEDKFVPF